MLRKLKNLRLSFILIITLIVLELAWLFISIRNNLNSNTVQTDAIGFLIKSALSKKGELPDLKKESESKNIYFWPGNWEVINPNIINTQKYFEKKLLSTYGDEYVNLPKNELEQIKNVLLNKIDQNIRNVFESKNKLSLDSMKNLDKIDNNVITKISSNLFISRYDWLGYRKNLYLLALQKKEGVQIHIASVSDAAEKTNFIKSIILPIIFLVFTSLYLIILNYRDYILKNNLEKIIDERTKDLIEAQKTIDESVDYASSIQKSLLPSDSKNSEFFKDFKIFWKPKEKIGGDIYWSFSDNDDFYFAIIDCTGHGIPGSLVSMITVTMFNSIINQRTKNFVKLSDVMSEINNNFINSQENNADKISNEGFDGLLFKFNKKEKILDFTSAKTPLFLKRKNEEIYEYKGGRKTVGYKRNVNFEQQSISLKDNDIIFLTTDGIFDQNNSDGQLYSKKRFISVISNQETDLEKQMKHIFDDFISFKKNKDQRDDITVSIFKI